MKNYIFIAAVLLLIFLVSFLNAEGGLKIRQKIYKSTGQPEYTLFNINNILTFYKNDGETDHSWNGNSGFIYPKGSNKGIFFQSGFLYGGKIDDEIRVGGSTFEQGQIPGRIVSEGIAENPELPHVRIYRVRGDYKTAELTDEIDSPEDTRLQYEKDWNEWPAVYGAPFEDRNSDGVYDPSIDIPGVPGAHQTIWYVCNDLDSARMKNFYGSPPIGIEMQMAAWGYIGDEVLSNTIFKKYTLINKSGKNIDQMYAAMWSDPDLGVATDDFFGCDTSLNLGYAYNGDDIDAAYGISSPAAGFKLIQGPKVGNDYLGMTSFTGIRKNVFEYMDPIRGNYKDGTLAMYNFFQGKINSGEHLFESEYDGSYSKYMVTGDPVTGEGWIDGIRFAPGDRRMMSSSGPFDMAPGDTQVVVFAQIVGQAINRFESIKLLRYYSSIIDSSEIIDFFPEAPLLTNTYNGIDDNFSFSWDSNSEKNEYDNYKFQGYRIYQFYSGEDDVLKSTGKEIEIFDKDDGIKEIYGSVMDPSSGYPVYGISYKGSDSGIRNKTEIEKDYINNTNFKIGEKYYFGVAAYYYDSSANKAVESNASIVAMIYKENYSGPKIRDTVAVNKTKGFGSIKISVIIDDPAKITGHNYKIWFSSVNDTIKWNLTDIQTNEDLVLDESTLSRYSYYNQEDKYVDGLKISIINSSEPITNFETVANQSGPIIPHEGAAAEFQGFPSTRPTERQQVASGRWLFHTGDNGGTYDGGTRASYAAFKARSIRNDDDERLVPYDWEMRFTSEGSYAVRAFQDGQLIKVPFELWCIGIDTPDDISDDYRVIPWIMDNGDDLSYNLESWGTSQNGGGPGGFEHSVSGGDDDPFTDWIYWINPDDTSPGSAGYDTFVSSLDLVNNEDGTYDYGGHEIMARTVLVNFNGGSQPPFNQELPETGTIFRITSGKYVLPGVDEYEFTTTSIENYLSEISAENKYTLSQNYPNPFNPATKIKYKIPLETVFGVRSVPVKLIVFDILGREVKTLVNSVQPPGEYEVTFNAGNYSSGVYIFMLNAGDYRNVKKMVLLK